MKWKSNHCPHRVGDKAGARTPWCKTAASLTLGKPWSCRGKAGTARLTGSRCWRHGGCTGRLWWRRRTAWEEEGQKLGSAGESLTPSPLSALDLGKPPSLELAPASKKRQSPPHFPGGCHTRLSMSWWTLRSPCWVHGARDEELKLWPVWHCWAWGGSAVGLIFALTSPQGELQVLQPAWGFLDWLTDAALLSW